VGTRRVDLQFALAVGVGAAQAGTCDVLGFIHGASVPSELAAQPLHAPRHAAFLQNWWSTARRVVVGRSGTRCVGTPRTPKKLAKNLGDFTTGGGANSPRDANQAHSVFMWTTGENAYLVAQDEMETSDVDILDITDPKHPVLIAEVDANDFDVDQPDVFLTTSFLHDVVVKEIDGRWIMLLSYWDGGWVLLDVTDPANPTFIGDTDYDASTRCSSRSSVSRSRRRATPTRPSSRSTTASSSGPTRTSRRSSCS
jgi:hypothetical protein